MKNKRHILFIVSLLILFANNLSSYAQGCAMCKTAPASDLANGGTIANGLNTGILYLMAIPYIILITGAYFFFKKPIDMKIKAWKNKHFPSKKAL